MDFMQSLTMTRPDDAHLHVRDGAALAGVVPHSARQFARAIIMPNLKPPVTTTGQALAYRQRILGAVPPGLTFTPLMTLYLTDTTPPDEIERARASADVLAVKYYPAGATTHSDSGVTDIGRCAATLARMEELSMPLLVHGEVTDPQVDIFDREQVFIERVLVPLVRRFPQLRLVLEHVTTSEGVQFVQSLGENVAASLTAHHLLMNRNALLAGGVHPHHYCLPVLKRENHRRALLHAATSGSPKFFLGTDSAPHARHTKEASCGCAGCYTAWHALELYAEAFESVDALDKLEAFASFHAADFYRLPRNRGTLTLERAGTRVPQSLPYGEDELVPLRAGENLAWRMVP